MDRTELDSLRAELHRLQARIDELEGAADEPVNRRGLLRGLGAAAAGAAVGGLAFAKGASAAPTDWQTEGNTNVQAPTRLTSVAGYTGNPLVGVFHVSNDAAQTNANAVSACISAFATGTGGGAQSVAFFGSASNIGAKLDGPVPLKLTDSTGSAAPTSAGGIAGQFKQVGGTLWYCSVGTSINSPPRVWRRLSGPDAAGAFTAITPTRVYDSRWPATSGVTVGKIAAETNRVVSVSDGRDLNSGAVSVANLVPAGATAVTANLTIAGTEGGAGALAVTPGDAAAFAASTINWTGSGVLLANGFTAKLDASRQLKVFCLGNATNFIVDITGYYR